MKKLSFLLLVLMLSALSCMSLAEESLWPYNIELNDYASIMDIDAEPKEEVVCGEYEYALLEDGSIELTGYTGNAESLIIPDQLDGYAVTKIGFKAFYDCPSLVSVVIPDSVTALGYMAFKHCDSLEQITIPASVTSFSEAFLSRCYFLSRIQIPDDHPVLEMVNGMLIDRSQHTLIWSDPAISGHVDIPQGVRHIGFAAFNFRQGLTSVSIPDSVQDIRFSAFSDCTGLESVHIPASVTDIFSYAFSGCSSLSSITLPDSLLGIGTKAFRDCKALKSIVIPNSVTLLGNYAFECCTALSDVVLSQNLTEIEASTFENCISLTGIELPASLTEIGKSAFEGCTALTEIVIPDSVTKIDNYAFASCLSLNQVSMPDSLAAALPLYAFKNCPLLICEEAPSTAFEQYMMDKNPSGLNFEFSEDGTATLSHCNYGTSIVELVLPDRVFGHTLTAIDEEAFLNHETLIKVILPDTVKEIRREAFSDCYALESISLPEGLEKLNDYAFSDCSLKHVTLPSTLSSIGCNPFAYCNLESLSVAEGSSWLSIQDGMLLGKGNETWLISSVGTLSEHTVIPDGVTILYYNALSGCSGMKTVSIPDSVKMICGYAFCSCSDLTSIVIPASVQTIGEDAFYNCPDLTLTVTAGSYAEQYAKENDIPYVTAAL